VSFDLYIQSFENGEPAGISRSAIRNAFRGALSEAEQDYWQLTYGPNESCALMLSPLAHLAEQIHNITVAGPCSNHLLWQSIAELLAVGNTVLYFPGGRGPLLLHPAVASHLPEAMLAALGQPIVVGSGADIAHQISAA
jgi:hypothetical protein